MHQLSPKEQELLAYFSKYIWWEDRGSIMHLNPMRIIANAMRYANSIDEFLKLCEFREEFLKETLKQAQAGWFDAKSWYFWHYRLYGVRIAVPPLPKRKFLSEIET